MSDPYRDELSPLRTRLSALRSEAADIEGHIGRAEELRRRRVEVASEIEDLQNRLRNLETQTTLDGLRIASPCSASWDGMVGDERVRFCGQCQKNVYNVAGMTRDEAFALLRANAGGTVCMRLFRRADGTVMTSDCPTGLKKKRVRRLAMVAGGLAAAATASAFVTLGAGSRMGEIPVAGGVRVPERPSHELGKMEMGDVAPMGTVAVPDAPPPPPPTPSAKPPRR